VYPPHPRRKRKRKQKASCYRSRFVERKEAGEGTDLDLSHETPPTNQEKKGKKAKLTSRAGSTSLVRKGKGELGKEGFFGSIASREGEKKKKKRVAACRCRLLTVDEGKKEGKRG